jgi:predicted transcriptional regulator
MADKKAGHVTTAWTDSGAGQTSSEWNDRGWKGVGRKVKIRPQCVSQQPHLFIEDYQEWFHAILGDNEEKLLKTIKDTDK